MFGSGGSRASGNRANPQGYRPNKGERPRFPSAGRGGRGGGNGGGAGGPPGVALDGDDDDEEAGAASRPARAAAPAPADDRDDRVLDDMEDRFEQIRARDMLDEQFGFYRYEDGPERLGWLLGMHPVGGQRPPVFRSRADG